MLTGKRVRLRALEPADSEAMWRWYHDPEVGRWMNSEPPISLAQNLEKGQNRPRNTFEQMVLGIETLDSRRFIGYVALGDTDFPQGEAILQSIAIGDRDHWGGGYGSDALRVICRYAFEEMGLHRVMLWVVADNTAAVQAYRKVGFVEEGRRREAFRTRGKRYDYLMMGMLSSELR
ncbi:GNAT family N-acetyltransferase [Nonomuraea jiangxiensis]|uniref:Protein N-acetyltransferase, RimJ/RimL family n=1 Tax=Nonomuraea jiangxiensis TaxID=633440 RepID=A0A1G8I613_9ACTN|nr:GNAT family protein [Nonomuraea jiangxiensis]SDI14277.1 Protein N-acetyltransferase, RimJ/RimL family [Nonomuraea jiangxiensis]